MFFIFGGMYNGKLKVYSAKDLGWTEDEYSNFMIDCFELMKQQDMPDKFQLAIGPIELAESVTITLTKDDFYPK